MRDFKDTLFENRQEAGQLLARQLEEYRYKRPLLLALPRGGVVVAHEVAQKLKAPLDVVVARKIGAPGQPEYGIGAVSEDNEPHFSSSANSFLETNPKAIDETVANEVQELKRRIELYRHGHVLSHVKDRVIIVIDDGLATGVTALAAAYYLKTQHPEKLILAVPIGPQHISQEIVEAYDDIICLHSLEDLMGVGMWYEDFMQVSDNEVLEILQKYH